MQRTRNGPDEHGFAMIMTVLIIMIGALLAAIILTQGSTTDRHSARGANWNQALQTADAGVERATALLQAGNGAVPAPFTDHTADGDYDVTVTYLGRHRYQIDNAARVGSVQGLASERTVRVILGPPKSFKYALFSLSSVDTKNNDIVNGDIWANDEVTVDQNDVVNGSVTSATKYVTMRNGSRITGDVQTGGYNSAGYAVEGRVIDGNVKASSTSPDCVDDPGHGNYRVDASSIGGKLTTWSSFAAGQPDGSKVFTRTCTAAPATKAIPEFTYNPANYTPAPLEFASTSAFQTYVNAHKNSMSGTFRVYGPTNDGNQYVDITGIRVAGDLTIVANGPITADQGSADVTALNNDDKLMVLVSYYEPPRARRRAHRTAATRATARSASRTTSRSRTTPPPSSTRRTARSPSRTTPSSSVPCTAPTS